MRPVRWAATSLLLATLGACTGGSPPASEGQAARTPPLGAPAPPSAHPPNSGMDDLEQPVADRLSPRLRDDGLTLQYVDCPDWHGGVPARMECEGYVDGVVGVVAVELSRGRRGGVEFDAWLRRGVVATARLVQRLEGDGYTAVDCGGTPAYPARPGMRMVCRVHDGGAPAYVVATVTDRSGEVTIEDY